MLKNQLLAVASSKVAAVAVANSEVAIASSKVAAVVTSNYENWTNRFTI